MNQLRRARVAIALLFFANGFIFACWAVHIPYVKARLELSEASLGGLLLFTAVGSLFIMPVLGGMIERWGSARVSLVTALGFASLLVALPHAPVTFVAALLLFVFGGCGASMDVAMNAQAVQLEKRLELPIMASFHALFSVGALAGVSSGSALLALGWTPQGHVTAAAVLMLVIVLLIRNWLLPPDAAVAPVQTPAFVLPTGSVLALGLLALVSFLAEGAVADWGVLYFRDVHSLPPSQAGWGFAAFSLMMALGRFTGDSITARLGRKRCLQASAALAAVALAVAVSIPNVWVSILAFGGVGLGLANIVPLLFSVAGSLPNVAPGKGIAGVAMAGYAGFLAGPPVIGIVAQEVNLSVALGLLAVLLAVVALTAKRVIEGAKAIPLVNPPSESANS
jgi:MFS family permease